MTALTFMPKRGEMAILAVAAIAHHTLNNTIVKAETIAIDLRLSQRHLEPLLQELVREGIINGRRGPKGGDFLNRPAASISLRDIVEAVIMPRIMRIRSFGPADDAYARVLASITVAEACL